MKSLFIKMHKIISGTEISKAVQKEIKDKISSYQNVRPPGLAVVLVGARKDSETYVKAKKKAATEVGMKSIEATFPEDINEEDLVKQVQLLNSDDTVDGILVQLPLPKHLNEERILNEISLSKDVDGFHYVNIGKLAMKGRNPDFVPCTPKGIIELMDRVGIQISGKRAVVIGRSNIVGLPVALLLMHRDATVTICHSKTKDLEKVVQEADIVIACIGVPEFVKGSWIKPGAVVIDVGINAVKDETKKSGFRLIGDVDFNACKENASFITPVPGGVGPMTIAMLLTNTMTSFEKKFKK
jgi:5,10-methylene-tetrahydrofolate dehydrogenase/methenyl tetrahydrofolate cyclohydrolase